MDYQVEEHGDLGRTRNGSPTFYDLLGEMAATHDRKSHDYASHSNPYGNYHFAGEMACIFSHSPKDAGFMARLAEKIFRLANLEKDGKIPQNESIADTERDIAVITALWMASRRDRRPNQQAIVQNKQSREEQENEAAQSAMIDCEKHLTPKGRQQMIDYLRACQRDEVQLKSTDRRSAEHPSQTMLKERG